MLPPTKRENCLLALATEMAKAYIQIAFNELKLANVVSFTLHTNRASQRVMEKAGMKYERDIIHADLPHVLYRLRAQLKLYP